MIVLIEDFLEIETDEIENKFEAILERFEREKDQYLN